LIFNLLKEKLDVLNFMLLKGHPTKLRKNPKGHLSRFETLPTAHAQYGSYSANGARGHAYLPPESGQTVHS